MKKITKLFSTQKGSALVITMMVLVSILVIVTSISLISVAERKMSGKFKNSTPAFQLADTGIEIAMKEIQTRNETSLLGNVFTVASGNSTFYCGAAYQSGDNSCRLRFFGSDGNVLTNSDTVSEVNTIRAVGESGKAGEEVSRAVESSVAAAVCIQSEVTVSAFNLAPAASQTITGGVGGAERKDFVLLGPIANWGDCNYVGYVSANDTVAIRFTNYSPAQCSINAGIWRVAVCNSL